MAEKKIADPEMEIANQYVFYGLHEALYVIIPILRIWVTRNRRHTLPERISEVFFWIAWIVGLCEGVFIMWNLVMYERNTTHFSPAEAAERMVAPSIMQVYYASTILYIVYLWSLKGAFIALYWTLFPATILTRTLRLLLYGVIGFLASSFIVNTCIAAFWCTPIHSSWGRGAHSCSSLFSIEPTVTFYVTNMVSDLMVLILPVSIIASLKLRRREALALVGVFGLGVISIIASTARFIITYRVILKSGSAIINIQSLSMLSVVEYATAMIAFCAPAFRGWLSGRRKTGQGSNPSETIPRTIGSDPKKRKGGSKTGRVLDSVLHTFVTTGSQIEVREGEGGEGEMHGAQEADEGGKPSGSVQDARRVDEIIETRYTEES